MPSRRPDVIRLAIVNDYELVVAGVAAMLTDERGRVRVIHLDTTRDDLDGVDLILYDTFGPSQGSRHDLAELVRRSSVPVVVFTWKLDPNLAAAAVELGASGYLSKALSGAEVVDALVAVLDGHVVVSPEVRPAEPIFGGDWPGRDAAKLSPREAEVLAMIACGLSNQEIADLSYLSINSVKTYVRTAYRKIGVHRRAEAVVWALGHGFEMEPLVSAATEAPLRPAGEPSP